MVDLVKAKQALSDALGSADEWFAVEFARDYGVSLIQTIEQLQAELRDNDRQEEHDYIHPSNRFSRGCDI